MISNTLHRQIVESSEYLTSFTKNERHQYTRILEHLREIDDENDDRKNADRLDEDPSA